MAARGICFFGRQHAPGLFVSTGLLTRTGTRGVRHGHCPLRIPSPGECGYGVDEARMISVKSIAIELDFAHSPGAAWHFEDVAPLPCEGAQHSIFGLRKSSFCAPGGRFIRSHAMVMRFSGSGGFVDCGGHGAELG